MRRGDVVLANIAGDYGKPRPAVIVQRNDLSVHGYSSVIVCPMTSTTSQVTQLRVPIFPSGTNGLRMRSEVMVEKISAIGRHRLKRVIGRLDEPSMKSIEIAMLIALGFV